MLTAIFGLLNFLDLGKNVFSVPYLLQILFLQLCKPYESFALWIHSFLESSLNDIVPLHVLHQVSHFVLSEPDDCVEHFPPLSVGTLLHALLYHIRRVLLRAEVHDVLADALDHLVLLLRLTELQNVLDDLVALLVFRQRDYVLHDLLLYESVQVVGGDALNDLLDDSAAKSVHAQVIGVLL